MKNRSVLGGIILIILGLFFLARQLNIPYMDRIAFWPLLLIGVGLFFTISALSDRKKDHSIFTGVLLLGIGIHFFASELSSQWPQHWAMYTLIVSIAFFAQFLLTGHKGVLTPAIVLLLVTLFSTVWSNLWSEIPWPYVWPILLIVVGLVFLFRNRK